MKRALDDWSQEGVEAWLARWLAAELGVDPKDVGTGQSFLSYGMNSVQAMMLVGDIEEGLGVRLSPTLAWDHPTVEALAGYIVKVAAVRPPASAAADATGGAPREAAGSPAAAPPDAEALLARLGELSEEEVDSLLQQYLK